MILLSTGKKSLERSFCCVLKQIKPHNWCNPSFSMFANVVVCKTDKSDKTKTMDSHNEALIDANGTSTTTDIHEESSRNPTPAEESELRSQELQLLSHLRPEQQLAYLQQRLHSQPSTLSLDENARNSFVFAPTNQLVASLRVQT
eukprot:GHVP01045483.1.p1 GENE.GHVP01045483.1~~GHVP01045483.1.p1  ORF type:complete len:145 (+),score=7.14 GHVP01045483.1:3-437(+)